MFIYFLLTAGHFTKNNKVNAKKNSADSKIEKKSLRPLVSWTFKQTLISLSGHGSSLLDYSMLSLLSLINAG